MANTLTLKRRRHSGRRGISIVLVGVVLVALIGFVSLAIDIGRLRLARAELQTAADASARSGAWSLPVSSEDVIDEALLAAKLNTCIASASQGYRLDTGVVLNVAQDVHFGFWNAASHTFTEIFDQPGTVQDERRSANAMRINARRIASRGNPLKLIFAPVLGVFSSDVEAEAIAYVHGGQHSFGFVGLDYAHTNGNKAMLDSVDPKVGTTGQNGSLASNGNIDLSNGDVYGDVHAGIGAELSQSSNSIATGWTSNLTEPLSYPMPSVPSGALPLPIGGKNADPLKDGKTFKLGDKKSTATNPTVYLGKFNVNPKEIDVTGWAVLYLHGNLDLESCPIKNLTAVTTAVHLTIYMLDAGSTVDIGGSDAMYAHIYAPLSYVKDHGSSNFNGWIVGKTLDWLGSSHLHYDLTSNLPDTPYRISLVR